MLKILRRKDQLRKCKCWYTDERWVGDDQNDVDYETDSHQEGRERFEFVVRSK